MKIMVSKKKSYIYDCMCVRVCVWVLCKGLPIEEKCNESEKQSKKTGNV